MIGFWAKPFGGRRRLGWAIMLATVGWFSCANAQTIDLDVHDVAYIEISGIVSDGRDAAPIAGAKVLAQWQATTYGYHASNRHCLRIAAAQTDEQGRFSLVAPADAIFREGLAQQYIDLRIYKAGFEERASANDALGRVIRFDDHKIFSTALLRHGGMLTQRRIAVDSHLFPATNDASDRLRGLHSAMLVTQDCETHAETASIDRYAAALAAEASSLATTDFERRAAAEIKTMADTLPGQTPWDLRRMPWVIFAVNGDRASLPDLDVRDRDDMTPLMQAAKEGDAERVAQLLDWGANPNRTRNGRDQADSSLAIAIEMIETRDVMKGPGYRLLPSRERYIAVIEALLRNPATNPDVREPVLGYTPLMRALFWGEDVVVDLLLKAGADPNLMAYAGAANALSIATSGVRDGNFVGIRPGASNALRRLLASKRLDLDSITARDGQTALSSAAELAYVDVVRELLEAGANPNAPNAAGQTTLAVIRANAALNPTHPEYARTLQFVQQWPGAH